MTFTAVKRKRKILFKVILMLTVFFNAGIEAYSAFNIRPVIIESITDTNNYEDSFSRDL